MQNPTPTPPLRTQALSLQLQPRRANAESHVQVSVTSVMSRDSVLQQQVALGYTTLQMMQTYQALAQADLDAAHRKT